MCAADMFGANLCDGFPLSIKHGLDFGRDPLNPLSYLDLDRDRRVRGFMLGNLLGRSGVNIVLVMAPDGDIPFGVMFFAHAIGCLVAMRKKFHWIMLFYIIATPNANVSNACCLPF